MWLVLLISIRGRSGQCTWLPEYVLESCTCLYCFPLIRLSWACYETVYDCECLNIFSRVFISACWFLSGQHKISVSLIKDYCKGSTSLNVKRENGKILTPKLLPVLTRLCEYMCANVYCLWWSGGTLQGSYCNPCMTVCVSSWMLTRFTLF